MKNPKVITEPTEVKFNLKDGKEIFFNGIKTRELSSEELKNMKIEPRPGHNECFHCGLQKGTIEDTGVRCANGNEHQFKDGGAPVSKQNPARMCQTCGSDNCHAWEAELAELLDENKPTKIRDFVSFLLAKQQEEFVKLIEDTKHDRLSCDCGMGCEYNRGLADIKSKLK